MKIESLVFVLTFAIGGCLSAKIALLTQFGRSHYIVMEKLGKELERRGNQVVILVGEEADYATGKSYVKAFKHTDELKKIFASRGKRSMSNLGVVEVVSHLFEQQKFYCDALLSDSDLMSDVKTADVLIGDSLYPCSALVADKFDLPHVVVSMSSLQTLTLQVYGVPASPLSYVPQLMFGLPSKMGFQDRIKNLGYSVFNKYLVEVFLYPTYNELKEKHNIQPKKTIRESLFTVDLILMEGDFVLDYAQPIMPYIREVGFFLPSPAKPLPADLEQFMQSSGDEGVILVAFGTVIGTLEKVIIKMMSESFSRMPQKILWKIKTSDLRDLQPLSPNIKTVEWLPQNDVLGHNKTKLFITHAGANGMAEAAYHGVPMVCSPFFGDQPYNAQTVKHAGLGEILSVQTATAEQMVSVMQTVIKGKSYRRSAARVSRAMKIRPRTPVQEAADLVEYVQAQGHLDHLKPRGLSLPFYQVYMLDVMAVLGLAVVIVLVVLVSLVKLVVRACCKSTKKTKTS